MDLETDFKELLELSNVHALQYLVVGAYRLAHHGVPRYTGDLDIRVQPSSGNADRVMESLKMFGFDDIGLTHEDFEKPDAWGG